MSNIQFAAGVNYYPAPPHAIQYGIFGNLVLDMDKMTEDSGKLVIQKKEKHYVTYTPKEWTFKLSGHDTFPDGLKFFINTEDPLTGDVYYNLHILKDWSKGVTKLRFTVRKSKKGTFYLMLNTQKKTEENIDLPF